MLSEETLKQISNIFCGDEKNLYEYKSGPQLVDFFNRHFGFNDVYGQGFPSRWLYVFEKIENFLNEGSFDKFLNIILSKKYLSYEQDITQVEAAIQSKKILDVLNEIVEYDEKIIVINNGLYHLDDLNEDLMLIGEGGFANVYFQKSTGLVVKKLKDECLTNEGFRSRFKREYEITKKLHDIPGVINAYELNEDKCYYTMEYAESSLEKHIINNSLDEKNKIDYIQQILEIITEVHNRDTIHRDLSPNNIFIKDGRIIIADFGLGKDYNMINSHRTIHTHAVGQLNYCAPEQIVSLKNADKRSDVFSLGRIINFIMNGNPRDPHHLLRSIAEKATQENPDYRYENAEQLFNTVKKTIDYNNQEELEKRIVNKVLNGEFDDEMENYIFNFSDEKIVKYMQRFPKIFSNMLISFMNKDDVHAEFVIRSIDNAYQVVCGGNYEAYDCICRVF